MQATARRVVQSDHSHGSPGDSHVRGMERLVLVVEELSLARNLAAVQKIVRKAARDMTVADGATFVLRDEGHCYYADEDAIEPLWKGKRFPMGICISGWVMLNSQPVAIEDIYSDARIPADAYRPTFVKSLAMVPIRTDSPIGAIGIYWAKPHRATCDEMRLLKALANTTAVSLENIEAYETLEKRVKDRTAELQAANEEIRRLALTDELTYLYNRRGFMLLGEAQLRQARRSETSTQLIFMDLNGLKSVNDQVGHEAGDRMLVNFATILRRCFRDSDVLARMGGDEFCALANSESQDADAIALRIREALIEFNKTSGQVALSTSIGVVNVIEHPEKSLERLVSLADAAMYADKQRSRA
ncbi:diguanylate cyclase [uncultured Bradyrhizobium sp.]|uniref:sensor domain-containing diguanylate cyclase n=1 Tax=uncultured Bradyrhizobium sp. TaxID=199684 RepID=UPI00261A29C8|nr:diguanylate cyclase [uncultured Bradyrhizobium sp.]